MVATFTKASAVTLVAVSGVTQVSGTTANDFTSPVVYAVTSSSGVQNYTVTVNQIPAGYTTGGSAGGSWVLQPLVVPTGASLAWQSTGIGVNASTYLETTGSGTLTFDWKVSSEANYDWLSVYVDGVLQDQISGEVNWVSKTINLGAGTHTVKWEYNSDGSVVRGLNTAWVGNIVFN